MKVDVLGGGIAGLTAVYYASKEEKMNVSLFERDNRLGGRLSTDQSYKIPIDVGSQLISYADIETMNLIKELQLSHYLKPFNSTFISTVQNRSFIPVSFNSYLYDYVSPAEQKIFDKILVELNYLENNYEQIIAGFSDYTNLTMNEWLEQKVGGAPQIVDTILRAICFSNSKTLSAFYGLTTLYVYLQNCYFLSNGMNMITDALNTQSSARTSVHLNVNISKIHVEDQVVTGFEYEENDERKHRNVDELISSLPASELTKLLPSTNLKKLLSNIAYNPCAVVLLKTKKRLWKNTWGLIFEKEISPVSLMFDNRLKHASLSDSDGLIGLLIPNNTQVLAMENADLLEYLFAHLSEFFSFDRSDVLSFKRYNWHNGLAVCTPELHQLVPKIYEEKIAGLHLCGGYMGLPSQDTAIESGRLIVQELQGKKITQ